MKVQHYRRLAYSANTKRTYRCQRNTYFRFCHHFQYEPAPVTPQILARYAAFLAKSLRPVSIACYLNVVRLVHLECGYDNPLHHNWTVTTVLRGIKRDHGSPPNQMMPITPQILRSIHSKLDLSRNVHRAFWAACVCCFFTFFRKSTLLPLNTTHDCSTEICRRDVTFHPNNAVINVKHTKTIQFGQRQLQVPIPCVPESVLCPVTAIKNLWRLSNNIPPRAPMFAYPTQQVRDGRYIYRHLTQHQFTRLLRLTLTAAGYPAHKFTPHSFRRGGASFSLACGIPVEVIKAQGDWRSNAVEAYLTPSLDQRIKLSQTLSQALSNA
jgi:hypothetical protein